MLCATLLLSAAILSAQDANQDRVVIRSEPSLPAAGSTWTLTLLVAHGEPNEVEVLAPHFSDEIFLVQLTKGPRLRNSSTGQTYTSYPQQLPGEAPWEPATFERWTAIEYRFTLSRPGVVSFNAFTVITPRWQAITDPFSLRVQRPTDTAETRHYQVAWEQLPRGLQTGESAIFGLRVSRWNTTAVLPEAHLFMPPVPQGCILESLPVSAEERYQGLALRLRVIALEAVPFVLERRLVSHNGSVFEIPALRIPVSPAERVTPNISDRPDETAQAESTPLFPPLETLALGNPRLYQKHRAECEAVYRTAKDLWERGNRTEALVILRQNERDHRAGGAFIVIRREAERALGLVATNNEKRRHLLSFLGGQARAALTRETAVRRIPDQAGEMVGNFSEGQPVLVLPGRSTSWLRVTANDSGGVSGWVPEERIIFY